MRLLAKPLHPNTRGRDVEELQEALRRLGFSVGDPNGFYGRLTIDAVRNFQRAQGLPDDRGVADERTITAINQALERETETRRMVRGRVTDQQGDPVAGRILRAFAVGVRSERELGSATSDGQGGYRIRYEREGDVDLQVRVFRAPADRRALLTSPLILGALDEEIINLSLGESAYRGRDEFSEVSEMVEAAMGEGPELEASDERSLILLARSSGLSTVQVEHFLTARRLERETEVPAAAYYGLLRKGGPRDAERLLEEDGRTQSERLLAAARDNIIHPDFERRIEDLRSELDQAAVGRKLSPARPDGQGLRMAELLELSRLNQRQRHRFLASARRNQDPMPAFWSALRETSEFSAEEVDEVQLLLQLAGTTLNHPPLVAAIRRVRDPSDARELAELERSDWLGLMADIDPPDRFRDANPTEAGAARSAYADAVMTLVAKSFPTARLLAQWNRSPDLASADLQRFGRNNPGFEFRETTVSGYLRENSDALAGIAEPERVRGELESLHRVFSLVPEDDKFEAVSTLWRGELRSAHAVVRQGAAVFHSRFDSLLGAERAEAIFANARKKTAMSLATLVHFSPLFQGIGINMVGNLAIEEPPDAIPDWRTLFGSLDYCECRHCRSILSPAAYFVDLLQFLETASLGEENGLEALLGRHRPDLARIQLDCPNTNTPLPYIDLVNEVLENAVINGVFSLATTPSFQTRATAEDLRANPEHIQPGAYDILAQETSPASLPFSLWHEERRIYLGHLKMETWELMDAFHREGEAPEAIDRAAAYLGLTALQREIITGEASVNHGLGTSNRVARLLRRGRLSLEELDALLLSRFVNPSGVEIAFEEGSCDLETATVALSAAARRRMNRFRRLLKALGWSVFDLDLALEEIGGGTLDSDFVIEAAFLKRIQERTRLSVAELVSWWSRAIPTRAAPEQKSLYEERFLNPTLANPLAPVTAVFGLNGAGTELANPQALLDADGALNGELGPLLTGGLNVTEEELRAMIGRLLPTSELTLDALSQLFRVASLSRGLGMSVAQYLTLVDLTALPGISSLSLEDGAFLPARPSQTWAWMALSERLLAPGFAIEEIEWLLLHRESAGFRAPAGEGQVRLLLQRLQAEMRKLRPVPSASLEGGAEPAILEEILAWLEQKLLLVTADAELVIAIALGQSSLPPADQPAAVANALGTLLDADALLAEAAGGERVLFLYHALIAHLSRNLVLQQVAAALQIEVSVAEALLTGLLANPDGGGGTAVEVFLAADFLAASFEQPASDAPPSASVAVIRQLTKLAFVFDRLGVRSAEVSPLLEQAASRGWLDLRDLPIAGRDQTDDLEAWIAVTEALDLNRRLFLRDLTLFDLFAALAAEGATRESVLALLAAESGWDLESLTFLTGPEGYDFTFPDDFNDARWLLRLAEAFRLIALAGVSGGQIWSWNLREADAALALRIKAAAKARHTVKGWLEIAPSLADELRRLRRDHLVDFLIANNSELRSADDLYEQLLIDPQMEPCFLTSRIKQAISSVQLFVQRVFLGLEPTVRFNDELSAEWEWRKHYRFREAALMVLLFPENFAEPELRANKSPLFKQLEQQLLQEEVTQESAERAYARYLRALDEIARLEISGLYVEGMGQSKVVHIFARTRGEPHSYYYRRWVGESYFTPWESVDVQVGGNHLIPVVYNRRLWLIWPVFEDRVIEPSNLEDGAKPKKYHRIRLSWSQYRDGKWTSVKTSQSYIETRANKPFRHDPKRRYYFWADAQDERLCIQVFHMNVIVDEYTGVPNAYEAGVYGHVPSSYDLNPEQPHQMFCFEGCQEDPLVYYDNSSGGYYWHIRRAIPYRTSYLSQARFMKTRQTKTLSMLSKIVVDSMGRIIEDESKVEVIFRAGASDRFDITPPHQFLRFFSQAPFFVEHRDRAFFVVPHDVASGGGGPSITESMMMRKDNLDLGFLENVAVAYQPARPAREVPGRRVLANAAPAKASMVYSALDSNLVLDRGAPAAPEEEIPMLFLDVEAIPQAGMGQQFGDIELSGQPLKKKYEFKSFYHPYTCLFIEMLNRFGVEGLLAPEKTGKGRQLHRQLTPDPDFRFSATYHPTDAVALLYPFGSPREEIDFDFGGAFSDYNWEVFFHIPLLIAGRLTQNQRFEEARHWLHFIFDPTETDEEELDEEEQFRKSWKIKPFYQASSRENVQQVLRLINQGDPDFEKQVEAWEANPFDPHLIASMRPVAYMKLVVMKYLDNLIAWADSLFRRDTIESINEAAQLYVLGAKILGRRPESVVRPEPDGRTYDELRSSLDALSNSLVTLENSLNVFYAGPIVYQMKRIDQGGAGKYQGIRAKSNLFSVALRSTSAVSMLASGFALANPSGDEGEEEPDNPLMLYFCAPHNEKLLGYWNTIADRLFKIRNCMNIEGVERSLALFEPPIDPALLVKAAAAGVDLSSALDDLNAPLPHYRFSFMLPLAIEFCNEVRDLGAALLSALEKKDAEALSLLQSGQEAQLLKATRQVKQQAISEASANRDALDATRASAEARAKSYRNRRTREEVKDRPGLIKEEVEHEEQLSNAAVLQAVGQGYDLAANIAYLFPDLKFGVQGISSPELTFTYGGTFFGRAFEAFGSFFKVLATLESHNAQMSNIKAGYRRREEDWILQESTALNEIKEIDRQITAAAIRVAMAEQELETHNKQIQQANETDAFLREKFTNEERYGQLVQEISTVYFQAYQAAYDMARRAERCFRFELGVENSSFIEFGYWDSLKKGLLAGELLQKDLRRMQAAYMEQNRRELEISQDFSLDLLDAGALLDLRETGTCEFEIPELAADLAYPGHYMRRIWSVSVTFACLTGPHTNVNATLTLLSNRMRMSSDTQEGYAYQGLEDTRFRHNLVGVQSIATSTATRDSGLLQFDFRDERYLPFEGAGVVSRWRLSLPETLRSFDYRSISTVVLHVAYRARNGGDALRGTVETHVASTVNDWLDEVAAEGGGLLRLISLRSEFPNALHRLLSPSEGQDPAAELAIEPRHFPYFLRGRQLSLSRLVVALQPQEGAAIETASLAMSFQEDTGALTESSGLSAFDWSGRQDAIEPGADPWRLALTSGSLDPEQVQDVQLLVLYSVA